MNTFRSLQFVEFVVDITVTSKGASTTTLQLKPCDDSRLTDDALNKLAETLGYARVKKIQSGKIEAELRIKEVRTGKNPVPL